MISPVNNVTRVVRDQPLDIIDWDLDVSVAHAAALAMAAPLDFGLGMALDVAEGARVYAVEPNAAAEAGFELDFMVGWPTEGAHPARASSAFSGSLNADEYACDYDYASDYELLYASDEPTANAHAVLFFDDDAVRLLEVVNFVSAGLDAGEFACLVLTPPVAASVRAALPASMLAEAERTERLMILDAESTLELFVRDGQLDASAFDEHVATSLRRIHGRGGAVRVYGEMVTLLWSHGNVVAALELERLWVGLQNEFPVSVFCAYPLELVAASTEDFARVCASHTHVNVL